MSEERRVSRVVGLVRDAEGRVLVHGEALPHADVEGYSDDEMRRVRHAFSELLGLETVVVRPVATTLDDERYVVEVALELEPLEPAPDGRWLAPDDPARELLPQPDQQLVERVFADGGHPLRPSWAHPGWFSRTADWLDGALDGIGRARTGPVEQISNWCISSILRAPTAEGDVYLKATARLPLFVDEGAVTRGLAERFPGRVPMPLAVDGVERLMLLDDFGPVVGWKADPDAKVDVLPRYAALQIESASMRDELIALGMFDRSPAWLAGALRGLLADGDDPLGLEPAERERLDALLPTFLESCEQLAAGPLPVTVVHGDLHLANIARNGVDDYVFFDWTDASIGNPLMDMLLVFFEEEEAMRDALRDIYLSAWVGTASPAELLEVWRLAEPLAALNQAISYRSIVDNVEPGTGDEMSPMLPWWLRKALEAAG
jgi:phosphotransferase family enzyme